MWEYRADYIITSSHSAMKPAHVLDSKVLKELRFPARQTPVILCHASFASTSSSSSLVNFSSNPWAVSIWASPPFYYILCITLKNFLARACLIHSDANHSNPRPLTTATTLTIVYNFLRSCRVTFSFLGFLLTCLREIFLSHLFNINLRFTMMGPCFKFYVAPGWTLFRFSYYQLEF
jgi:hypothetical protein